MQRSSIKTILLFILAMLLAAACTTAEVGVAAASSTTDTWSVRLSISGGFAGVRRQIEVDYSGRLLVQDQKLKKKVAGSLDSSELEKLAVLVRSAAAKPASTGKPRHADCFDCYRYTMILKTGDKETKSQINGLQDLDAGKNQLVQHLLSIMRQRLSSK